MPRRLLVTFLFLNTLLLFALLEPPALADDEPPSPPAVGILTPPAVEESIIYFIAWPGTLYAFDESTNQVRWTATVDPILRGFDYNSLPMEPPVSIRSYVLVHLGRQLWGISKIDGRSVWNVDSMLESSHNSATSSSDTLPGFYVIDNSADGAVLTLEQNNDTWFCRRRMLGNGNVTWENRINGEPRGWWFDKNSLWLCCEFSSPSGPGSADGRPAVLVRLNSDDGSLIWSADIIENASFRSVIRAEGRLFLIEEIMPGDFRVRAFNEETGELFKEIDYSSGSFIKALSSSDKLVFLFQEEADQNRQVKFLLYFTSLNPIRLQSVRPSRADQLFSIPDVNGNLFFYGGAVYSLYDGNLVWRKDEQITLVDWAADDNSVFYWEKAGSLVCLDRLTGTEKWRTPFNVLPAAIDPASKYGGASLTLIDNRLFASTPAFEVIRIDPSTGVPYPGILRVSHGDSVASPPSGGNSPNIAISILIWAFLISLASAIAWIAFQRIKLKNINIAGRNGDGPDR